MIIFSIASIVYPVVFVMITPFVTIYTSGVTDTNYFQPLFGIILAIAGMFSCFRIPYETIVKAVGHYKQTRNGAFAEAIINIVLSVIMVLKLGLVEVAIGTLAAAVFRTFQYATYLARRIIKRSIFHFLWHLFISLCISVVVYIGSGLYIKEITSVLQWIIMAVVTTMIAFILTLCTDFIFYKKET